MKNVYFFSPVKIALLLGLGLVVIALVSNFASKPPTGKTGAPGEGTCMDCHTVASSTIDGSMELSGLTSPIVGGMTYDLVLTMKKTAGSPVRAGFELNALDNQNVKAGSFMLAGSDPVDIQEAGGREYVRHSSSLDFDGANEVSWNFKWMAPETGSAITFYASTVFANKGNGNEQDKVVNFSEEHQFVVSTQQVEFNRKVNLFPNPATDNFTVNVLDGNSTLMDITIMDNAGRIVKTKVQTLGSEVSVADLPNGIYQVEIKSGDLKGVKSLVVKH